MHITPFGEINFPLEYFVGHKHGRMYSCHKILCCIILKKSSDDKQNHEKLPSMRKVKERLMMSQNLYFTPNNCLSLAARTLGCYPFVCW